MRNHRPRPAQPVPIPEFRQRKMSPIQELRTPLRTQHSESRLVPWHRFAHLSQPNTLNRDSSPRTDFARLFVIFFRPPLPTPGPDSPRPGPAKFLNSDNGRCPQFRNSAPVSQPNTGKPHPSTLSLSLSFSLSLSLSLSPLPLDGTQHTKTRTHVRGPRLSGSAQVR